MSAELHSPDRGRILPVVTNDRESETRTPAEALYRIPEAARDPFTSMSPLPFMRHGEEDLTRIAPGRPQASGQPIVITGRVVDEDLRPVRHTLIEVWNANTHGRYSHSLDEGRSPAPLDPHFYGFGRLVTDADGRYRVRTIKPGAYIARKDIAWWRPPHVHFSIVGGGVRLVTQMYFPDEPLNLKDYIHLIIPEPERPRVIGKPVEPDGGALSPNAPGVGPRGNQEDPTFRFDMVVRGRYQTPLERD